MLKGTSIMADWMTALASRDSRCHGGRHRIMQSGPCRGRYQVRK